VPRTRAIVPVTLRATLTPGDARRVPGHHRLVIDQNSGAGWRHGFELGRILGLGNLDAPCRVNNYTDGPCRSRN